LGRFSLAGLVGIARSALPGMANEQYVPLAGEGAVFADWITNGELCSALLLPPSEIKSLMAQIQAQTHVLKKGKKGSREQSSGPIEKTE
jgi:hypothetical protein